MEQQAQKLFMNQMTRNKLYQLFGLRRVNKIKALEEWLSAETALTEKELVVIQVFQDRLLANVDDWNEQELSLGFIGPILNLINFKIPYELNFYAQRHISGIVGEYELIGKPDGIIASGGGEPEKPFFSFHEYKKDVDSSGDPAGQNLAAMLVGQTHNQDEEVVYGCYVVGRFWYFMVLEGNQFAISQEFSATSSDLFKIVQMMKYLKHVLIERLGLKNKVLE
ncbi:MAG: hypothetical protein AAGI49_05155 [Bacteroidota bacterium]